MRLAVTVGFDARLVVRALANIPAREVTLVRGATGNEGDAKSKEAVAEIIKALGKGTEYVVNLRDPAEGLRQFYSLQFDEIALAGGPRLLILLGFVVAALKKARIFVVPEYSSEAIDVSGLAAVTKLFGLSRRKLEILAVLDGEKDVDTIAREVGLDNSTVYRHLVTLEEEGLTKSVGKRGKRYHTDKLISTLSSLILKTEP